MSGVRESQRTTINQELEAAPRARGSGAYLLVVENGASQVVDLPSEGALIIGRSTGVDLRVQAVGASRRHARLTLRAGAVSIIDLGSRNGTRVNQRLIEGEVALRWGDVITIGECEMLLRLPGTGPTAAATAAATTATVAGDEPEPPPDLPAAAGGFVAAADGATEIRIADRVVIAAEPRVLAVFELLQRLAAVDLPVLIVGETGVGKENAAHAVHAWSPRAAGPFVPFNCAALPDTLIESELFGHERGAFTGAVAAKPGLFEAADGGTLFLDEIAELSLAAQAKLLRALEVKRVTRVGGTDRERAVDVRFVAATNRDLAAEVAAGRFRSDLLYRLNAATVVIPPLRERQRDLAVLIRRFLDDATERRRRAAMTIAPAAALRLAAYGWPGNVRELKNLMGFLAATITGDEIAAAHLPRDIVDPRVPAAPAPAPVASSAPGPARETVPFRALGDELRALERERIVEALRTTGGVKARAARLLGVPLRTFMSKLKQLDIVDPWKP